MLLHSREGSGEHRSVDINALVDDGLSLACHGARAEKQGFNVKLERSFDPNAGEADVFPQDITRVLLNLISNGFYAATSRDPRRCTVFSPKRIVSAWKAAKGLTRGRLRWLSSTNICGTNSIRRW